MFGGTKTLSVSKITSKGRHFQRQISYQQGAWHVTIQLTWGSPVKVQQIFQNSINLGQSNQDFKISLNSQNNLIQDSFIITWGIRMSKVFNHSFTTCWKLQPPTNQLSQFHTRFLYLARARLKSLRIQFLYPARAYLSTTISRLLLHSFRTTPKRPRWVWYSTVLSFSRLPSRKQ